MLDQLSKECHDYIKGNKCSNYDAPNPNHSRCVGRFDCENYQYKGIVCPHNHAFLCDTISWPVKCERCACNSQ
uniref:Uncharacterized protein n=1 Tax=viral metagenome TaxID=1070528 RepID=A0A6H1ZDN2_9ZZZZ